MKRIVIPTIAAGATVFVGWLHGLDLTQRGPALGGVALAAAAVWGYAFFILSTGD